MCSNTFGPAMLPSLFICPIRMMGVLVSLAYLSNDAAHSLTCDTLPGEDSMASVDMVCMESMTTRSGFTLCIWVNMFSNEVSHTMRQSDDRFRRRSARSLSCRALSSPDTYNTFRSGMRNTVCNTRVDLPMPGSPPNKTNEPGTMPPPSTRFSSSSCMSRRASSVPAMSDRGRGRFCLPLDADAKDVCRTVVSCRITSSTNEFHAPHEGHLPTHLGESCPQLVHT